MGRQWFINQAFSWRNWGKSRNHQWRCRYPASMRVRSHYAFESRALTSNCKHCLKWFSFFTTVEVINTKFKKKSNELKKTKSWCENLRSQLTDFDRNWKSCTDFHIKFLNQSSWSWSFTCGQTDCDEANCSYFQLFVANALESLTDFLCSLWVVLLENASRYWKHQVNEVWRMKVIVALLYDK
jgi:hypothetical protein